MISVTLTSNAAAVAAELKAFPNTMLGAIARALDLENQLTIGQVQAQKLSGPTGPTTLSVRSNRLRSSIRASQARINPEGVQSSMGTNVGYGGVHEYGFDATVTVRSFTRKQSLRAKAAARASGTFDPRTGRIARGRKAAPTAATQTVRSHQRHMKIPARRYLQSTIESRAENYRASISAAILAAWQSPGTTP
jgi:hypothetical protein